MLLYNIPQCVPYNIPVELVAELAQHANILGIKDSSGAWSGLRALAAGTRDAARRTVTVTPVFEAVTGRMLKPEPEIGESLVTIGGEAAQAHVAPLKTRTKEVGFQVLSGSTATLLESLEAGANGAILGFAACAPQACQEVYLAWKDRDRTLAAEKQQRIVQASRRIVGELGISGVKYACDFNGYYGGRARAPLTALCSDEKAEIEALLALIRS